MWLALVWLLLLGVGDPLSKWGVIPFDDHILRHHRSDIVWLGLAVVLLPYVVGAFAAMLVDQLSIDRGEFPGEKSGRVYRTARSAGLIRMAKAARLLQHPSAWDKAWSRYIARQGAGEVVVRMKDGLMIKGGYGKEAQVDLSPLPPQLFLASGYGYNEQGGEEQVELNAYGPEGVYVPVDEIEAIYFGPRGDGGGGDGTESEGADAGSPGGGEHPRSEGAGGGDRAGA